MKPIDRTTPIGTHVRYLGKDGNGTAQAQTVSDVFSTLYGDAVLITCACGACNAPLIVASLRNVCFPETNTRN